MTIPQADLSITNTDGQTVAVPGQGVTYTIVVSNGGPTSVVGASVTDTLPEAITGASWTCVAAGGGTCASSGTGSISDAVDLPVGGTVTYALTGTVVSSATGSLSNTASVATPGSVDDPDVSNNSATDITSIDSDGKGIQFTKAVFAASEPGTAVVLSVTRKEQTTLSATVDYATTDGTATAGTDYVAKTGALSFAPGGVTKTLSIALLPNPAYDGNESFLVALFNPQGTGAELGFQRTTVVAITDKNPVPTIQFSVSAYSATEPGPAAKITVVRSGLTSVPVTVHYATADGTATAPTDYTSTAGTLSLGAGILSQTFTVTIVDDLVPEPAQYLSLLLSSPGGGAILGGRSTAKLTLKDLDQAVQFSSAAYTVSEASAKAIVTVKRTGGTLGTITVAYATGTGTATEGSDYQAANGTLTFGPGVVTQTFGVPILNDALDEGSETVPLTLSSATPASALGAPSSATLTILDNEPVVQFSASKYTGYEPAGTLTGKAVITVKRLGGTAVAGHVNYATSPGTAVPGLDYSDAAGELTFAPGVASQTFAVPLLGNTVDAAKPTVNLALTPVDIPLGTPSAAVLTIADNDTAGTAQLGAAAFSGFASGGALMITVTRSGGTAGPASVQYTTSDGTAAKGLDYTATTGTVTFGLGETTEQFSIPVAAAGLPNKYFFVTLGATTGNLKLGTLTQAPVWILE